MQTVKMYATGTCPYCIRAKQILKAKGVEQLTGVRYDRIDDAGLHVTLDGGTGEQRLVEADTIILCTGQESVADLAGPLREAGVTVHVIGGADVAVTPSKP